MEHTNEPIDGFTCQICSNTLKTTFVTVCGDSRHCICANCYNRANSKCPMCWVISSDFSQLVFAESPEFIDSSRLIMHQTNTEMGSRIFTALIKPNHEDDRERTALNISNVARYFTRTKQDASGQKTINPNFCGESIIDIHAYVSFGAKKLKGIKTATREIIEKIFTLF